MEQSEGTENASASEFAALRARVAELERHDAERRKALAALRAVEERYELALGAGKVGVWEWNVETQTPYLSPNLKSMLGYGPGDIPDTLTDWLRLVVKEDRPKVAEATRQLVAGEADTTEVEHRKRTKDGGVRWINGKGTAVRDPGGKLLRIVGADTDITERKRSEEADERAKSAEGARAALEREIAFRKRIELRLAEAQKLARLGSWEWDMETDEVFLSDELLSIFGRHRGEFVGTFAGALAIVHPEDRPVVVRLVEQARATQGEFQDHLRIVRPDGATPTLHLHGRVGLNAEGQVVRLLGTAQDVTEVKAAEKALRESEARFRNLADTAPVMIWMSGPDAQCTFFNKPWLDFTGKTLAEQLGEGWKSVIHPDDLAACERTYMEAFSARVPYEMEYRVRRADGERRWVFDVGVPRLSPEGEFLGFVGSCVDIDSRRRAEAALRESEQRYRSVVGALEEGIILQDAEGVIRACNAGAEMIFGVAIERIIGRPLAQAGIDAVAEDGTPYPPDKLPPALSLKTGEPFSRISVGIRRPDGALRWISMNSQPLFKPGEALPYAVVSSLSDVTERRRHEMEIQREKEFSQNLIDSSLDGIHAFDRDCRITVWNPAMERITGKRKEEALGRNAFEVFPFLLAAGEDRHFHEALQGRSSCVSDDARPDLPAGEKRHFERHYSPLRGGSGRIEGGIAIIRDVTEQKLAETALRNIAEGVSALTGAEFFKSLALFLSKTLGADFCVIGQLAAPGSSRVRTLALCDRGEAAENIDYDLEHTPCAEIFERNVCVVPERASARYPLDLLLAEMGVESYIGVGLADTLGKTIGLVSVMHRQRLEKPEMAESMLRIFAVRAAAELERLRAEEERRRLEMQIQQAQKLESLGVLAGGIAHDFNNLLVGILGNAGLALMDIAPESPARQSVESIEKAAVRAADLTRQMLAYSGKGRFIIEPINLASLVKEMADLLEISISKSARLKYEFEPDLPAVEGDATQLRQVVMNLITNASDAIGDRSGVISISVGSMEADSAYLAGAQLGEPLPDGRYVYIEVSDTGVGMDAETRAKIFDPFFTTKFTGRGLGLAAVLGIVRGHQGAIRVYSEPGKGTTIKVLLPATDAEARPLARRAPADDWRGAGLVLIVDDEESVRDVAQAMAERAGFEVVTAADGELGVEVFRARAPEISAVLLDMTMPRMNGEQAFREIRRIRPDTPVILLSGYNEQDATNRFAGKGLAGFIQKPFRYDDLVARLRMAVGGRIDPPRE